MSDLYLMVFGCVVSFIAVAGAYAFVRESYAGSERPTESDALAAKAAPKPLRRSA